MNAVPHGLAAVQGRPFPSPFASPPGVGMSPPLVNALWSSVNAGAGVWMLRPARGERAASTSWPTVAVGALAMMFVLAGWFGRAAERSRP
ncbi:hypothetical protein [Microbacterium hominis]|uniref:Uncharacterized protein n=1 Tax=Microbacterium hominis TaxID=162426 RepID=A0A7D4Q2T7_9MICO|nr:hypothetical protein [Microbacterium hominis]QKJ19711.1 hypothetical protein HQM25_10265 [Microbacterium hominis]